MQVIFLKVDFMAQFWQNGYTEVKESLPTLNCNILITVRRKKFKFGRMHFRLISRFWSTAKILTWMPRDISLYLYITCNQFIRLSACTWFYSSSYISSWRVNMFVVGARGLSFESWGGQIGRSVANGSPSMQIFSKGAVFRAGAMTRIGAP